MPNNSQKASRFTYIDLLRICAVQFIILHHLAFYGPMSDIAMPLAPSVFHWFSQYARIAVQVFLVMGGFLAARALAPHLLLRTQTPIASLANRYLKLAMPFAVALLISLPCAALSRQWIVNYDYIPDAPTLVQFLANLSLLHGILGIDPLIAGAWYIAIDFQLYATLLLTLWISGQLFSSQTHQKRCALTLVGLLATASLFYFNRNAAFDNFSPYFFAAYALGILTSWQPLVSRRRLGLFLVLILAASALMVDFRLRILVALCAALFLLRGTTSERHLELAPWMNYLAKISYSIFLIHFPVILLIGALFTRFVPALPAFQLLGIVTAWALSLVAGAGFYRWVEAPCERWVKKLSLGRQPPLTDKIVTIKASV